MSNVYPFPGEGRSDGGGPEDPMLEQRVTRLEEDMKEVKASLKSIEIAVAEIKHLPKMTDYAALKADVAEIKGKLSNLPTTWTLISFAIGSVLASAGLAFAIARLIRP